MSGVARKLMSAAGGEAGPEGAWDLSYAYYDPPVAWDVSTAIFQQKFSVATQEILPHAVFFKPDGLKMYVIGFAGDDVNEYDLSTAWDVSSASFLQSFSVSVKQTNPHAIFFKPDGTKMYVTGASGNTVHEYNLSTAWNVSTSSFLQSFSVATQSDAPKGLFFKSDGTKMYVTAANTQDVNEYNLSTAWDISTASYLQDFSFALQDAAAKGLFFKPDGTKMYLVGEVGVVIIEYNLSTAWDVSTASFVHNFSVSGQETQPAGVFFRPDGFSMYVIGLTGDDVNQYILGGFSVAAQETSPQGVSFKPDGTKMYVTGTVGDDINEYSLSTAWNVSTASFLQSFSVAAQETSPQGVSFKSDGTKMYVVGVASDSVHEYDLSTAWSISTATFLQSFSVATQETQPRGLFFKFDGTKMYVIGTSSDAVQEYNLSTAWSISTATFLQSFSVATQETLPLGLFFKFDGTKMYVIGTSSDAVQEYNLNTAWDVSSASFSQSFSVSVQDTSPSGIFFQSSGTQMLVLGSKAEAVFSYTLGVQE